MCILERAKAIEASLSPDPITIVLDSVIDTKMWMKDQTPRHHDHLKAHHFNFKRTKDGDTCMLYKEWSTDSFWLPDSGLALLPAGNSVQLLVQMYYYMITFFCL